MSGVLYGRLSWAAGRDSEGYKVYEIVHEVVTEISDGPATAGSAPGLPLPGAPWIFGNDVDLSVWCRFDMRIEPYITDEPNRHWKITQNFSNKPLEGGENGKARCQDYEPSTPLQEYAKVSGGTTKKQKEATEDRFDTFIRNSAHEIMRGDQVEFDENTPTIRVSFNTLDLQRAKIDGMLNKVNKKTTWGNSSRTVKLSDWDWEKLWYGSCFRYFRITLEFEVNPETFDRDALDEGTKALSGEWNATTGRWDLININGESPDASNPSHFNIFKDKQGENCRVILDGEGKPYVPDIETTTDCSFCNGSGLKSPVRWVVRGFTDANDAETTTVLTYAPGGSDCYWEDLASPLITPMTLEYNPAEDRWEILLPGNALEIYVLAENQWNCNGINRMAVTNLQFQQDYPLEIRVEPEEGGQVGSIRIEKYKEADFFDIIGLPVDLEAQF